MVLNVKRLILCRYHVFYWFQLEEHLVTLAVDGTGTVREFTGDATFLLPEAITTSLVRSVYTVSSAP